MSADIKPTWCQAVVITDGGEEFRCDFLYRHLPITVGDQTWDHVGSLPGGALDRMVWNNTIPRPHPHNTQQQQQTSGRWRVGVVSRTTGRTLYRDGELIGLVDTAEIAEQIVAAMNEKERQKHGDH